MASARQRLKTTFDSAADLYQRARPEYPEQLYDALVETTGLDAGDRLVEVGCATGKATLALADWETSDNAEEYLQLLDRFSGHIAIEEWTRFPGAVHSPGDCP